MLVCAAQVDGKTWNLLDDEGVELCRPLDVASHLHVEGPIADQPFQNYVAQSTTLCCSTGIFKVGCGLHVEGPAADQP